MNTVTLEFTTTVSISSLECPVIPIISAGYKHHPAPQSGICVSCISSLDSKMIRHHDGLRSPLECLQPEDLLRDSIGNSPPLSRQVPTALLRFTILICCHWGLFPDRGDNNASLLCDRA
ncbi:hypothetical protein ABKN59_003630 [Abortiporus biennis]